MTNYEWLKSLSINDLTSYLFDDKGFKEWLEKEHELKPEPCPVCKGKMNTRRWGHGYYLVCEDCGMHFGLNTDKAEKGIIEGGYSTRETLVDAWNLILDTESSK